MHQRLLLYFVILLKLSLVLSSNASNKIEESLRSTLNYNRTANIIISFKQSTLDSVLNADTLTFGSRGAKIFHMKSTLEKLAEDSQKNVRLLLKNQLAHFESYWASNQIFVEDATTELVLMLSIIPEVAEIRMEKIVYIEQHIVSKQQDSIGWNMKIIELEDAWEFLDEYYGFAPGQGVVVATIGTGVRFTHESLAANYRSSYGWYDPIEKTSTPVDAHGHGTHIMGILAGSHGIGIAPGATWITCRACLSLECLERHLFACGDWMACPTDPDGNSPDCDKAPNVVSNSWTTGAGDGWYTRVINTWKSANIIPVFSVGNCGAACACGSVQSPGDDENVIGVGATDAVENVASFSSRGPSFDGTLKPDVSAPGQNIRSAWHSGDGAYNTLSGTSLACPHVAGLAALILTLNPEQTYDEVKNLIQKYSDKTRIFPEMVCAGTPSNQIPNNIYGHGRINAGASVICESFSRMSNYTSDYAKVAACSK